MIIFFVARATQYHDYATNCTYQISQNAKTIQNTFNAFIAQ